jgi:hypothetical protein
MEHPAKMATAKAAKGNMMEYDDEFFGYFGTQFFVLDFAAKVSKNYAPCTEALMLFKDGIRPEWEDAVNSKGGHFTYQLKVQNPLGIPW